MCVVVLNNHHEVMVLTQPKGFCSTVLNLQPVSAFVSLSASVSWDSMAL